MSGMTPERVCDGLTWREAQRAARPWWWWLNPWLYIARRDDAYADALEIIHEECAR